MSLALKLKVEEINSSEVKQLITEDIQQFCSMFHTYFEVKGEKFAELDKYIQAHYQTICNYVQRLDINTDLAATSENKTVFSISDFRQQQKAHIKTLSKYENPQIAKILNFKKDLLS